MKIVITGSKGQVASQLIDIIDKGRTEIGEISKEIIKAEIIGKDSRELDITNFKNVKSFIEKSKPDIVINAAAYTNVDQCEINKDKAFRVNALGARNLAIACENVNAKLVHISTDYVFSGEGNKPFTEYEAALPQSVYGKSKNMGDEVVKSFSSKYFIVRPSWVYGYKGNNFVYNIMKAANDRGILRVVNDQIGNPTNVEDLAHHILKLMTTEEYGVYHCSGHGQCSWYDFACKIIELAKIPCEVKSCSTDEYPRRAKRPNYSALDNMMLRGTIGDEMRTWEDALKAFIENII